MVKLIITILLILSLFGCNNSPKDMAFEIVSVSSGIILDEQKTYESHDHEWKSSDGEIVSVELIMFVSENELRSFLGNDKVEKTLGSKDFDGRLVVESTNDKASSITLWNGNKLIKIKAPTLEHALAFEKCCSKQEFNNF